MRAPEQLRLFTAAPAPGPVDALIGSPSDPFFCCTPVDLSGASAYVLLIRGPDDPERGGRNLGPERDDVAPHLTQRKTPAEEWAPRILAAVADGTPRTFNRICVEMLNQTADVASGGPLEEALWSLVMAGRLAHTMDAPVYFAPAPGDCA